MNDVTSDAAGVPVCVDSGIGVGLDDKIAPDTELKVDTDNCGGDDGANGAGVSGGNADDADDIEQVSATILGNIVVLDEVMNEIAAFEDRGMALQRKGGSSRNGYTGSYDGDNEGDEKRSISSSSGSGGGGKKKKSHVMVSVSVQTDPLAPEQLRSLVDSMVMSPRQDQGCVLQ